LVVGTGEELVEDVKGALSHCLLVYTGFLQQVYWLSAREMRVKEIAAHFYRVMNKGKQTFLRRAYS